MNTNRRYTRLSLLVLLALGCWGGRSEGEVWEQGAWSDTVYYRATFNAAAADSAVLHVAAVDGYEVFFNGVLVGADSVWTRMGRYGVEMKRGKNEIGAQVVNRGRGVGNGLLAAVIADSLRIETTNNARVQPWYWTAESQEETGWTTLKVDSREEWQAVQEGTVDRSRVEGLVDSALMAIAGLPGGIDVGEVAGSLTLGRIRGENLALGRPSNRPEMVDGNLNSSWDPPTNARNLFTEVDLRTRRKIHAVRVLTRGRNEEDMEENSLRGYSVQVSDDQITWSEVAVLHDIVQYFWSEARFAPVWTRHVRIVIVDLDPTTSPRVAEMEVFGDGFKPEGLFLSGILRPGDAGRAVNFGRIEWEASTPEGTELGAQFRSGDGLADFEEPEEGWSAPLAEGDVWFPAGEPGALFQYRVRMVSDDGEGTPIFRGMRFDYSAEIAVSRARGRVSPQRVPMGEETAFTYVLDLTFGADDLGIAKLAIEVPGPAQLEEDAPLGELLSGWRSSQNLLTLDFAEPQMGVQKLEIPLRTKSYTGLHAFRAYLFGPGSENPLNVAENRDISPDTGRPYSWSVAVTSSQEEGLTEVGVRPPLFTPNGDRVNDYTVVEFALSKVEVPKRVRIQIFDLSGGAVRQLHAEPLAAGAYVRSGRGDDGGAPGFWDGRDDAGELVPPGLYIYRVEVDLDTGDEARSGVVGVVY
jgi:hypothetical protein